MVPKNLADRKPLEKEMDMKMSTLLIDNSVLVPQEFVRNRKLPSEIFSISKATTTSINRTKIQNQSS